VNRILRSFAKPHPWLTVLSLTTIVCGAGHTFAATGNSRAAEHITLTNGFELICDHREQNGDRIRLYTDAGSTNYVEVASTDVAAVEKIDIPVPALPPSPTVANVSAKSHQDLTPAELHELLSTVGAEHRLDVNLLASIVRAESGGHTAAVSKKGAQGLMQLMPATAMQLGVSDSLQPEQNVSGGVAYLDSLLARYHNDLALALAAYNAGPAAVDRWHGVPPYRETRLSVARIIREFNASVRAQLRSAAADPNHQQASLRGATAP
jgi:hypothetical protein